MKKKLKLAGILIMGTGAALFSIPGLSPLPTGLLVLGFIVFVVGRSQD